MNFFLFFFLPYCWFSDRMLAQEWVVLMQAICFIRLEIRLHSVPLQRQSIDASLWSLPSIVLVLRHFYEFVYQITRTFVWILWLFNSSVCADGLTKDTKTFTRSPRVDQTMGTDQLKASASRLIMISSISNTPAPVEQLCSTTIFFLIT